MTRNALLASALLLAACDSPMAHPVDDSESEGDGEPKPVAQCERGERGEPGPPGARGPAGVAWRPSTYRREITIEVDPHDWNTALVECDQGDLVLHGGCEWGSYDLDGHKMGSVVPYLDMPIGQDGGADTYRMWQCQGQSVVDHVTTIYAVALCLEMEPDQGE